MTHTPLIAHAASHTYPVYVGNGVLCSQEVDLYFKKHRIVIVTQQSVISSQPSLVMRLRAMINEQDWIILPEGESAKNLETWEYLLEALMKRKCDRQTWLAALGGGVVGDMVGFAAACYQRGIPYVQMPTTLIAQVDSAIGGKTGINHARLKNMIGAFYPPRAVFSDVQMLLTLPPREFHAGLAEVIKYGLIADATFFDWITQHCDAILARDLDVLVQMVRTCAAIKIKIVNEDEREITGLRSLLNFGHTFGHALEACAAPGELLHGEAVSIGMVMASRFSSQLGLLPAVDDERIRDLLHACHLPVTLDHQVPVKKLYDLMQSDKKVMNGRVRLVLLQAIGDAVLTDQISSDDLVSFLTSFC